VAPQTTVIDEMVYIINAITTKYIRVKNKI
jgi:hypothetical protein